MSLFTESGLAWVAVAANASAAARSAGALRQRMQVIHDAIDLRGFQQAMAPERRHHGVGIGGGGIDDEGAQVAPAELAHARAFEAWAQVRARLRTGAVGHLVARDAMALVAAHEELQCGDLRGRGKGDGAGEQGDDALHQLILSAFSAVGSVSRSERSSRSLDSALDRA